MIATLGNTAILFLSMWLVFCVTLMWLLLPPFLRDRMEGE